MEVIIIIFGYIVGSISFSYLIAKKVAGIDIRQHGSKNAGATNTLRMVGTGPAIMVLGLDILKGILAVLLSMTIFDQPWVAISTGIAVIIGHNWPIFFGFKGGKGVATTIGVVSTLFFLPALAAGVLGLLAIIIFRYVSLGSLLFVTVLPLSLWFFDYDYVYIIGSLLILILTYYRHRANIGRIVKGTENKIGKKTT